MRIKEVEALTDISRKNIRFYEKEGLLSPGREQENSYRDYAQEDIDRLYIIKLLRRLDMPISEIRDVLDRRQTLTEAVHLHALLLQERKETLENAQRVCRSICDDGASLDDLDAAVYLERMDRHEADSLPLVDVGRRDADPQLRESLIVGVIIITLLASLVVFLISTSWSQGLVGWIVIGFSALLAIVILGVVLALKARIKEIKRGEEHDLSHY